jgi:hypothetical protein
MCHIFEGREMNTGFGLGNLKAKDHFEELGVHGRIILLFWIRTGTSGRL